MTRSNSFVVDLQSSLLFGPSLATVAVASAVATAFTGSILSTIFALVALVLCGALGALAIFPRRQLGVEQVTAILVVPLAILLVTGFALTGLHIRLDHRSVSVFVGLVAVVLGIVAYIRRTAVDATFKEEVLPTESDGPVAGPADKEGSPGSRHAEPQHVRSRRAPRAILLGVFTVLVVGSIVVTLVSNVNYERRESFIALSATLASRNARGSEQINVVISNHNASDSRYRLTFETNTSVRQYNVTVRRDDQMAMTFLAPARSAVTVRLYQVEHPNKVYREVDLRGGKMQPLS